MRNRVTRRIRHTILGAMQRGRFITFEGGDGVGKSTQIQRLAQHLLKHGIDCVVTREPGGTPFAERVREFILAGQLPAHPPMAEALLFAAARYDHIAGLIRPRLMKADGCYPIVFQIQRKLIRGLLEVPIFLRLCNLKS